MKILRVNMEKLKVASEELPEEWRLIGGRGLIARIMRREVPPDADPLGTENKLIIAGGPLAGTMAPQLGRISVGGKSPLTLGIKEANAGGPAAQKLDRLNIRAIIVEGIAPEGGLYCLKISKNEAVLVPADDYRGMKNYQLAEELYKKHNPKSAIISIGICGERKYKAASVSLTDIFGDPSRNAARGGMGAVMGSKGLKAIIIDDSGTPPIDIADKALFKETVSSWVDTIKKDVTCGLFSKFGTPFAVASNSYYGSMPADNYTSGRAKGFGQVTGEVIKRILKERGGRLHPCMPGCVVQCSMIYNDSQKRHLASAYEYEGVSLLGTNLGITDLDAIGRLKFMCDDLGLDFIEIGGSLSVAISGGKLRMGDAESTMRLIVEIEQSTEFGQALANGVVSTAKALGVSRVPAIKGQGMPAHDPRAVKGTGVTLVTSPMGGDHTAGLTYRIPSQKTGQIANSLRFQIQAATCDTVGYCLNSVPGGQASVYDFFTDLLNARYGLNLRSGDVFEIGKQTLRDELEFNKGAEFSRIYERYPAFIRTEPLSPTNNVFDVEDTELDTIWERLETATEPRKVWEVRFPPLPSILFGIGAFQRIGEQAAGIHIGKALLIADPVMQDIGHIDNVQRILVKSGVDSVVFSDLESDPPVEEIERIAQFYRDNSCDGLIGLGGGSSLDAAKATAVGVSQSGLLTEYESLVGGAAKIRAPLPPLICIPTTSGTGSEVNQFAVITDKQRGIKFTMVSNLLVPKVAIIDPVLCRTMPPGLTAETGIDALCHCVEAYVCMAIPYHPYCEALALRGVQLVGWSLRKAYADGEDIDARTDMCMAATFGGISLTKGLGLGHAISHVLGAYYHLPHGRSSAMGLLCFVRANNKACREQFKDLAYALARSDNLEASLENLYKDLNLPARLKDLGVLEKDLGMIAFEVSNDVANLASNPAVFSEHQILELLKESY